MHLRASVFAFALGPLMASLALPAVAAITINGTTGSDVIDVSSSSEAHLIFAKKGADVVYGSSAGDVLDGGSGNDRLYGNDGADVTLGGPGNDLMSGGTGDDEFRYVGVELYFDEIDGGDRLRLRSSGSDGADLIGLRAQPISVELIDGRGGFDIIRLPDSGSRFLNLASITVLSIELIQGGSGHDTITGSAGADVIRGGSGNDVINGGPGRDTAVYLGESESYQITWGTPTVVRALIGSEGTDQLTSVEVMTFADGQFEDGTFVPKYPDNRPPVATADSAVVPEDSQVEINLLANDYDPDSDPFSIVAIGSPSHGTVKPLAGGAVLYVPRADFHGTDTFTYRIADDKYGKSLRRGHGDGHAAAGLAHRPAGPAVGRGRPRLHDPSARERHGPRRRRDHAAGRGQADAWNGHRATGRVGALRGAGRILGQGPVQRTPSWMRPDLRPRAP